MDKAEAREVLLREVEARRQGSYAELSARIPEQAETHEVLGASGTVYQVMTQVDWDAKPGEAIRVTASIDDGGWSSYRPMCEDFIMAPDGTFVGE